MGIAKKALAYAIGKIGCKYSQEKRWENNIFDCSSLVYRGYQAAGYTFKSGSTSTTEVYDTEFDLIWPENRNILGTKFTSIAELRKKGYKPQPGDVVYINTSSTTTRKNKITHVVLVENDTGIVHARGTAYGVRRDNIDIYGSKIVAVTRFKEDDRLETDGLDGDDPKASSSLTATYPRSAVCTGDGVRIRKTPDTSSDNNIITSVNKDHPLVVQGKDGDSWLAVVTLKDEKAVGGYMSANYISN